MVYAAESSMSTESDNGSQVQDMERLLERAEQFASTVQQELSELNEMREAAVAASQREADEILAEATEEAEQVLARAEETAQETVQKAHAAAADITSSAGNHMTTLRQVAEQYRVGLQSALATLQNLPQIPAPAHEGSASPETARPEPRDESQTMPGSGALSPAPATAPEPPAPTVSFTVVPGAGEEESG